MNQDSFCGRALFGPVVGVYGTSPDSSAETARVGDGREGVKEDEGR